MKTIAFHKKASENAAMFESNSLYSSMIIGTNTETCLNDIKCDLPPVVEPLLELKHFLVNFDCKNNCNLMFNDTTTKLIK